MKMENKEKEVILKINFNIEISSNYQRETYS